MIVLSIDQASNNAGVSLWQHGMPRAWTVLAAKKKTDPLSVRLVQQRQQLETFLNEQLASTEDIDVVLFENVKSKVVLLCAGAFLSLDIFQCKFKPKEHIVHPSSWKSYLRKRGATGEIKGVKALEQGWPPSKRLKLQSDDVADSMAIYLAWQEKYGPIDA